MITQESYEKNKRLTTEAFKKKYKHLFDYKDDTNQYCIKCIMRKAFKTDVCVSDKIGYIDGHKCIQLSSEWYDEQERLKQERYDQEYYKSMKVNKYDKFECGNTNEIINHVARHNSIYLWGESGKGKTHFLNYIKRQKGGLLIMSAEMNEQLKKEIKYPNELQKGIKTRMKETPYLYLDDLGNEKMSEYVQEALQIVIDYRYRKALPTYITSNYSLASLYKMWGQPDKIGEVKARQLVDRIRTFGAIEIKGKNYRKTGLPEL